MGATKAPRAAHVVAAGPRGIDDQLGSQITPSATLDQPKNQPARSLYLIRLRPEPGVDAIRAMRHPLERGLRAYGPRCVSVLTEDAP
jgi:hypothetical protein